MDAITEFAELIEEFGTSVFSFRAFVGIVVMIVVFVMEVKWTRSHAPRNKRVEKALTLGHVVEAKRVKFWNDAITSDEWPTSWYHATYAYEVSGRQYEYKYLEHAYPPMVIKLYYMNNPRKPFREKKKQGVIPKILFLIIPIAAGVGVMYLLGGV